MNLYRLRILCTEINKTINNLNSDFMRDLLNLRETSILFREKCMLNLNIYVHKQVTFGSKSLRVSGPKVWNSLPYHKKSSENRESFKMLNTGTVQGAIVKFVIQHKIQKDGDCLSKANLGLLIHPGCTTLGW